MSITSRDLSRKQVQWGNFYAYVPEDIHDGEIIEEAKGIIDYVLPQKSGPFGTHYYSFLTREYVLNLILFFYRDHNKFPEGNIAVVGEYYWRNPPFLHKYGLKQCLYEKLKGRNYDVGYWVKLPSLKEVRKANLLTRKNIALWTSQPFLEKYFCQLKFDEPYSKAYGSIAGGWVKAPWGERIKNIVFDFVYEYVNKFKKLPEGQHSFDVDWSSENASWLKRVLNKKQVVTFPKISEVKYD